MALFWKREREREGRKSGLAMGDPAKIEVSTEVTEIKSVLIASNERERK